MWHLPPRASPPPGGGFNAVVTAENPEQALLLLEGLGMFIPLKQGLRVFLKLGTKAALPKRKVGKVSAAGWCRSERRRPGVRALAGAAVGQPGAVAQPSLSVVSGWCCVQARCRSESETSTANCGARRVGIGGPA